MPARLLEEFAGIRTDVIQSGDKLSAIQDRIKSALARSQSSGELSDNLAFSLILF
jgi:hypothetical protein